MKTLSVCLIALLLLTASLVSCRQTTPEPPSVELPAQTEETSTTPNEKENPDIQPEKILAPTSHGLILWGSPDGKYLTYGLGSMFIPPGDQHPYPYYEFPLFVSKTEDAGPDQIFAEIPDPELQEIGAEWQITIEDPDYGERYLLRVKLIRVTESHKYNTEFAISVDDGQSWSSIPYPLKRN